MNLLLNLLINKKLYEIFKFYIVYFFSSILLKLVLWFLSYFIKLKADLLILESTLAFIPVAILFNISFVGFLWQFSNSLI